MEHDNIDTGKVITSVRYFGTENGVILAATDEEEVYDNAVDWIKERIANDQRRGSGWRFKSCLLYTSPSPRDRQKSRMPSSA